MDTLIKRHLKPPFWVYGSSVSGAPGLETLSICSRATELFVKELTGQQLLISA